MPSAATNVHTVLDAIDGLYVKVAWDDANDPATVQAYWFYTAGTTTTYPSVYDKATRTVVFAAPGGIAYSLEMVVKANNQLSARTPFTIQATLPAPPPVPTAEQQLEAALGLDLPVGSRIEIYPPDPVTTKILQADGSLA